MTYKLEFTVEDYVFDVTAENLDISGLTEADLAVFNAFLNVGIGRYHGERARRHPSQHPVPPF